MGDSAQHKASQAQRTDEAKTAFNESLKAVGANIDSELQARAKTIHSMDDALTKQEKDLRMSTKKVAKQNDDLQKFVDKSNKQFASFDNIGALQTDLETDLQVIEEMLQMLEGKSSHYDRH